MHTRLWSNSAEGPRKTLTGKVGPSTDDERIATQSGGQPEFGPTIQIDFAQN